MSSWKKYIPDGTRDILLQNCENKILLENSFRKVFKWRGYSEVITPTLEFYDVFDEEETSIEQEKMYKLFDNQGRILVLRPDITIPIERIAGTKLKESCYPLKLSYCLNVFRTNGNWNGRRNEFTQSGVEIIGIGNFRADVEVIVTAIKAFLESGIKNFKLELGQVQFYKGIIKESQINSEDLEKIRGFIENKNFGALKDFLDSKGDLIDEKTVTTLNSLPRLFGDINVIEEGRKITSNKEALNALDNIEDIYEILKKMGLSEYISIDLGLVNHVNYYTGIVFRGYIEGAGGDVLYGGRYDKLIKRFGADIPATGFAINVDSILETMSKQYHDDTASKADFIIFSEGNLLDRANMLSNSLIKKGCTCELSLFDNFGDTKNYAVKKGIKKILIAESEETLLYDVKSEKTISYIDMEVENEKSESSTY
jgi:ATP phosphoribosyltransferase regulatory subunit